MCRRTFFFVCASVVMDPVGDLVTTQCYISPSMAMVPLGILVSRIFLLRQAHKTEAGH